MTTQTISPNESYLTKQSQRLLAAALTGFLIDIRRNVGFYSTTPWESPDSSLTPSDDWRVENMRFVFGPGDQNSAQVIFSNVRWDSQHSKITRGKRTIDQNVFEAVPANSKIIRNDSDDEVEVEYKESVEVTNREKSVITKGVTRDLTSSRTKTAKGSITAKTGTELEGVKAELTVAAEFGVADTDTDTKGSSSTETGETATDGTRTEDLRIKFTADPRTYYSVSVLKEATHSSQPWHIDGIQDAAITVIPGHPNTPGGHLEKYCPYDKIEVDSFDEWEQFVHGYDVRYPAMEGYWNETGYLNMAKIGFEFFLDPTNRRIRVEGIRRISTEGNVTYKIEELGQTIPPELTDLPVLDAQDVAAF